MNPMGSKYVHEWRKNSKYGQNDALFVVIKELLSAAGTTAATARTNISNNGMMLIDSVAVVGQQMLNGISNNENAHFLYIRKYIGC